MISKHGRLTELKKSAQGWEEYDSALEREYMVELERNPAVKRWTKKHGISISTQMKGESAEEYCKKQGWKYKKITKGSIAFYTMKSTI